MTVLEQLTKLSSAEDYFRFLGVSYDPAVLNVARLHILRRMGDNLREAGIEPDQHFGKSPDQLGPDDLRSYQAYLLRELKLCPGSVENHVAALRFFRSEERRV